MAFKKAFTGPVAVDTFEFSDASDDEDGSVEEDGFDKLSALFIQDWMLLLLLLLLCFAINQRNVN